MTTESIYEVPIITRRINAEEARASATDFLLDHVDNQLVAGEPHMMVSAVRAVKLFTVGVKNFRPGRMPLGSTA